MSTAAPSSHAETHTIATAIADSSGAPWLQLRARIREALACRRTYVANSRDLSLLWRGERVDAMERRRRIIVFAAQYQWRVETHPEGTTARFQVAPASGLFSRENLSRNHE